LLLFDVSHGTPSCLAGDRLGYLWKIEQEWFYPQQ